MGTLNRGSFLGSIMASLGIAAGGGLSAMRSIASEGPPPSLGYYNAGRYRSRIAGPRRPAGSKLARKAEKHRVGIAVLR